MIVQTLKMCTSDAGPEQSLVLFLLVLAQAHNKYRYFQFLYIIYEYLNHLGLFVSIYNGSGLGLQACGNNMSDLVSFHSGQVENFY